jgi:hypothetical protein
MKSLQKNSGLQMAKGQSAISNSFDEFDFGVESLTGAITSPHFKFSGIWQKFGIPPGPSPGKPPAKRCRDTLIVFEK